MLSSAKKNHLISFLKLHLLYIQILPSESSCCCLQEGSWTHPSSCKAPLALQRSGTALSHPAKDMQGESQALSRHLGKERTQQQWSCAGPCFEQVSAVAWESNPGKTSIHVSNCSLKIYSGMAKSSGKKGQGKKGVRNGTDYFREQMLPTSYLPKHSRQSFHR